MMFSGVLSDHVDHIWDQAKPFIERAIPYANGKHTIESVYQSLKSAKYQLWVVLDPDVVAAGVTSVQSFPGKRVCCVMFTGGEGQNWPELSKGIEDFARHAECDSVELWGRRGWERALPDYQLKHVVLSKEL